MTVRIPLQGPCEPWVTGTQLDGCAPTTATVEEKAMAARFATRQLWNLSGCKPMYLGACADEMNPSTGFTGDWGADGCWYGWPVGARFPSWPVHDAGGWSNIPLDGGFGPGQRVSQIILAGPISAVLEVWVDGVELTAGVDYDVSGWRALVRLGTDKFWPVWSDPRIPKNQPGSFFVKWTRGFALASTEAGQVAKDMALIYARKKVLAMMCSSGACNNLSDEGIASASEDGITVTMMDLMGTDEMRTGRTGVPIVDDWLRQENPRNKRGRSRRVYAAWNPMRRSRRFTGTTP